MNLSKVKPHQDHLNFNFLISNKININSLKKKNTAKEQYDAHTQSFILINRHICNMHLELQTFAINILILC